MPSPRRTASRLDYRALLLAQTVPDAQVAGRDCLAHAHAPVCLFGFGRG